MAFNRAQVGVERVRYPRRDVEMVVGQEEDNAKEISHQETVLDPLDRPLFGSPRCVRESPGDSDSGGGRTHRLT